MYRELVSDQESTSRSAGNQIQHGTIEIEADGLDSIDRRGFLKCIAWAGNGLVWTFAGGVRTSHWAGMTAEDRILLLTRIAADARSGEMPPEPYAMAHPANRLTESDKQEITTWARAE